MGRQNLKLILALFLGPCHQNLIDCRQNLIDSKMSHMSKMLILQGWLTERKLLKT